MTTVKNNVHKYVLKPIYQYADNFMNFCSYKNNAANNTLTGLSLSVVVKSALVVVIGVGSANVHAAILSDNSERRIEVRHSSGVDGSSNAYISSKPVANNKAGVTIYNDASSNRISGDSLQGLIEQKQRQYNFDGKLSIEENKRVQINKPSSYYGTTYRDDSSGNYSTNNNTYNPYRNTTIIDFNSWLNSNSYRAQQAASYQRYLSSQIGAQNVPPLNQLLTTARSWDRCGYEPYQLPPQELWSNVVPTLRLYSDLKNQGVLPANTEIRSVYRSPNLNDCAGGAANSKHMTAGAMDIWVPDYDNNLWLIDKLQDDLCQFWQYQGQSYSFGLGLYSTGAIHLDTQGYRKWGFNYSSSSACRF